MKNIFLFLILFSNVSLAQINISEIVNPRFYEINSYNKLEKESYVIINKNDSIFLGLPNKNINLDYLDKTNIEKRKLLRKYTLSVFYFTNENSKTKYFLRQWNSPLFVFFDKRIPKKTIESFKKFFKPLNKLNNLKINYTKNIDEANYYIKLTEKKFNADTKRYSIKKEEDIKRHLFNNANYKLISDNDYKTIGCVIETKLGNLNQTDILEASIKQAFYLSLGRFFLNEIHLDETSLISPIFKGGLDSLSDFDFNLLKIHYSNIYDQKINGSHFSRLTKLANKKQ